jgi:hypothetical protein
MNKYQEHLDEMCCGCYGGRNGCNGKDEFCLDYLILKRALDKANKYDEKETPKKIEIIDKDLIFHSTPQPTKYYLTIRCSCKAEFDCRGYQHWKAIDKKNVEKDYFEYEYTYCPHCGQRIEE